MTVTLDAADVARAQTLLQASLLLLDAGEGDLALAALDRADAGAAHLHQVKRARAIALARLGRPLDAARTLQEELALAPDDVEAFRTFLGMLARVPEVQAMRQGFLHELLPRLDAAADAKAAGPGAATPLESAARYVVRLLARAPALEEAWLAHPDAASRSLLLDVAASQALGGGRVAPPGGALPAWAGELLAGAAP